MRGIPWQSRLCSAIASLAPTGDDATTQVAHPTRDDATTQVTHPTTGGTNTPSRNIAQCPCAHCFIPHRSAATDQAISRQLLRSLFRNAPSHRARLLGVDQMAACQDGPQAHVLRLRAPPTARRPGGGGLCFRHGSRCLKPLRLRAAGRLAERRRPG